MARVQKNLGDILVEEGVLSREELDDVLEKSKARNLSTEETLFRLGYLSRDKLGDFLAKLYGCEFVDLYSCKVDTDAIELIPVEEALELQALPYALEGNTLTVALAGESFEDSPLEEIASQLEQSSGKKVRITLCNPGALKETLARFCRPATRRTAPGASPQGELETIIRSLKPDQAEVTLRGRFEELYDIGQTALIGARSHPFSRAVAPAIEEAKSKLTESRKYVESGFEEEAIDMAKQAVALIKEATIRAVSFENDWENLLQQVKRLRNRIGSLENAGAAEYASLEFKELVEIRDGLLECVSERNVEKLRSLLDQGMVTTEKVGLMEPGRTKGREQVIANLAQVREVITRARDAGAKQHAPEALKEACEFLDKAEMYARQAQWDEVRECLSSAESKGFEAERAAAQAAKEKEQLTIKLRESIREAMGLFEEALTHPFAPEVMEDLMRAKDVINETKLCFESDELERGIGLAQNLAKRIKSEIVPLADEAERVWNELFQRAKVVSAQIESVSVPLALKVAPEKMKLLFQGESVMVASLWERDRRKLADSISVCEGLAEEIGRITAAVREDLVRVEAEIKGVSELLTSAASTGIDLEVASAYDEARRALEEARSFFEQGQADAALTRAQAARAKLATEVTELQGSAKDTWNDLTRRAIEASEHIQTIDIPLAMKLVPEKVGLLFQGQRDVAGSLSQRNREKLADAVSVCEEVAEDIRQSTAAAGDGLRQAETAITEATAMRASAATAGIDKDVASAYEEAGYMLEEARTLLERGDSGAALDRVHAARAKLESEVIDYQNSARQQWNELAQRARDVFEKIHAIDMPLAMTIAREKLDILLKGEGDLVGSLAARDRERLADAVSSCEGLAEEIVRSAAAARESVRRAEAAVKDAVTLLASAGTAPDITEQIASAYLKACSTDAAHYCPDLVRNLRSRAAEVVSALTSGDPQRMDSSVAAIEETVESIGAAIEIARAARHKEMSDQLAEIEDAVQTAVHECAGNYSPDMLEDAYLDLTRIKDRLSTGPETMSARLENELTRELAVARTKVWQVEFMRERVEREREETLNHLRLKMRTAREAVDECAKLDFVGDSSPDVLKARELLGQVDNLMLEGDIDGSFEMIRRSEALADRILDEAGGKESEWLELANLLTSEGASHRAALADPDAEKVAEEEYQRLCELDAQTQSIVDARDFDALKQHAESLGTLAGEIAGRVENSKKEACARLEEKLREARQEIRLADLLGAKEICPDVINAARTYSGIADGYLAKKDFVRGDAAARDALAKAQDAATLAHAGSERARLLALDYMKIADAHLTQENPEAAKEAIERGLELAQSDHAPQRHTPDSETRSEPDES